MSLFNSTDEYLFYLNLITQMLKKKNYGRGSFISLWLCWVFVDVRGPSLAVASGGYSLVAEYGLIVAVASRCRAQTLGHVDFSSCSSWALERGLSSCGVQA